ncbi:MAG TPA: triose-phosphate isomerase [Candidatus Eisenbacteria bacterium]|jgi:triosephosphate isomerase|nr:triose-phosphate isomerase [Candidatus Eisenbacteria bacterium]
MTASRRPVIAGNWKLNKTIKEAIDLVTMLKRMVTDFQNVDVIVCPPFTALSEVSEILMESEIRLGAQDLYWEEKGAFTGEVSATLLKDAGASFVIVGHSERRQFFHETHETVNKKTRAALKAGLTPIVCVGESLTERETGKTFSVLSEQLKGAFAGFTKAEIQSLILAYEPVWAIGTGKVATPAQAQEAHAFIRNEIAKAFGEDAAQGLRIQYGGSVKADNIAELMRETDIDGALVGGASLDAAGFAEIVKNAAIVAVG